jgi:hypothetical protein
MQEPVFGLKFFFYHHPWKILHLGTNW